jgi:hypothetical protein
MAPKPEGRTPSPRTSRKGRGERTTPTRIPASATRLAAVESSTRSTKKKPKVSYSTYVDADTNARVDWLVRHRGFTKTDITGDALDALLDTLNVPAADDIDD